MYFSFHKTIGYIENDEYHEYNENDDDDGYKYLLLKCNNEYKEIWDKTNDLLKQKDDDDDADYNDNK